MTSRGRGTGRLARLVKRRSVWLIFGSILIGVGMATAATIIFTQTFPSVGAAGMTEGCGTLTYDNFVIANGPAINYDCGGSAAITIVTSGSFTPAFTLPTGGSALYIVTTATASPGSACTSQSGDQLLATTPTAIALTSGEHFNYCLTLTANPTSVPGFSVTWSQ